ncbi:DUF3263 domain-containing protein [Microbacterium sp. NPDC055599]
MSDPTVKIGTMTPADLLAFEHQHPAHTPDKTHAIRHQLRTTEVRYYTLLLRAAHSAEGIKADPVTARQVRERGERSAAKRMARRTVPSL